MEKGLNIREITSPDDKSLDILIPLYDMSFPDNVKEDPEVFRKVLGSEHISESQGKTDRFHMLAAFEAEKPVGFISFNYIAKTKIGFVGYIVIEEKYRGHRIGEKLMKAMAKVITKDAKLAGAVSDNGIIFEVERAEDAKNEHERNVNRKRIAFFERIGAKIIPIDYWQPPLHNEDDGVRLYFMCYKPNEKNQIKKTDLVKIVKSIYDVIYATDDKVVKKKVEYCKNKTLASINVEN
jgi:GNAT superfamily N-acetyltransferase